MDDHRFDALAKRLAAQSSRRRVLKALPGVAVGALFAGHAAIVGATGSGPFKVGALATFQVCGGSGCDTFHLWTINSDTIAQLAALQNGTSSANIPVGPIYGGMGRAAYNAPWNWYFDPIKTTMAETAIELCDAEPSFVEANLRYFIVAVGSYCPWASQLVALEVFSNGFPNT